MKVKKSKKLTLSRETLRQLENGQLPKVAGGASNIFTACNTCFCTRGTACASAGVAC